MRERYLRATPDLAGGSRRALFARMIACPLSATHLNQYFCTASFAQAAGGKIVLSQLARINSNSVRDVAVPELYLGIS
jgi:hypothetical protein